MIPAGTKPHALSLAPPAAHRSCDAQGNVALCGSLEVVPIFDVIQWVCGARQSWLVRVTGGGIDAAVAIVDGELVDAQCGGRRGQEALIGVLETKAGRFELQPISGELQRTLRGNWMATLLTAAQKSDEGLAAIRERQTTERAVLPTRSTRSNDSGEYSLQEQMPLSEQQTSRTPPANAAFRSVPVPAAPESSHLIDLGFAAVKAGNVEQARRLWTQALEHDPSNRALQFNLRKLEALQRPTS